MECRTSPKRRYSECFAVSIGVYAVFLNTRASRNSSKGLKETLLDRVVNMPAIVDPTPAKCSRDSQTRSKVFITIRAIYWACAGKQIYGVKHVWFLLYSYNDVHVYTYDT